MIRKLVFQFEKLTKNTVRYREQDEHGDLLDIPDALMGTAYLKKRLFADGPIAEKLYVTISDRSSD